MTQSPIAAPDPKSLYLLGVSKCSAMIAARVLSSSIVALSLMNAAIATHERVLSMLEECTNASVPSFL